MDQSENSPSRFGVRDRYATSLANSHTAQPAGVKGVSAADERHANETAAQLVAFLSPYMFWIMVAGLATGILILR